MQTEPAEPTLVLLEQGAQSVVGKDWYSRLDKTFTGSLGKYRKYKGGSVRDMLRAMRNKVCPLVACEFHCPKANGCVFFFFFANKETSLSRSGTGSAKASGRPSCRILTLFFLAIPKAVNARVSYGQGE